MDKELLNIATSESLKALRYFCENLSLSEDILDVIYNVKITVENNINGDPLVYMPSINTIQVDKEYLDDLVFEIERDTTIKTNIIHNLSKSIVHELLHAKRIKLIGINTDKEMIRLNKMYDKLLDLGYIDDLRQYAPVKISRNNMGTYDLIVYNADVDCYESFSNLAINNCENLSDRELFLYVTDMINNDTFSKSPDYIISDDSESNEREGFEEIMTEVIADIIVRSYVKKNLDIDALTIRIINDSNYEIDYKMGAKLLKKLGKDLLVWFITADDKSYNNDILNNLFGDKYMDMLEYFNELYQSLYYGEVPSQSYIDVSDNIIKGIHSKR